MRLRGGGPMLVPTFLGYAPIIKVEDLGTLVFVEGTRSILLNRRVKTDLDGGQNNGQNTWPCARRLPAAALAP